MFCPKCGTKLPDGSKFCGVCGERLEEPCVGADENKKVKKTKQKSELSFIKKILFAVAAIVVIVFAVGTVALVINISNNDAFVYISDNAYKFVSDFEKDEIVEIDDYKGDDIYNELVQFTPDGKYVYYFTKFDSDSMTGTLCCAEYDKLKADSNKNDKYIKTIDTNVFYWFDFYGNDSIVYSKETNDDYVLNYYSEGVTKRIEKGVADFYLDDSGKLVYVKYDGIGIYSIVGTTLDKIDRKTTLATDVYEFAYLSDIDDILYFKKEENGSKTLYVVGFEKESEKLAENLYSASLYNGRINGRYYFATENGKTLNLYDYVEDSNAGSRSTIKNELKKKDNSFKLKTLYCYDNGELTIINEEVMDVGFVYGAVLFNTVDMITEKPDIEEISSIYDVYELFELHNGDENRVIFSDGTVGKISAEAAETIDEEFKYSIENAIGVYFTENKVYIEGMSECIYEADIENGIVEDFNIVTDNGKVVYQDGDVLYYISNNYSDWDDIGYYDDFYGNLYYHKNGTSRCIIEDCFASTYCDLTSYISIYDDGTVLAYTDYYDGAYELTMHNTKGETFVIDEEVTQYIRVDASTIMYISDDDLYCYSKEEKTLVAENVDHFWSINYFEPKWLNWIQF